MAMRLKRQSDAGTWRRALQNSGRTLQKHDDKSNDNM